jgi:hypothetical protein
MLIEVRYPEKKEVLAPMKSNWDEIQKKMLDDYTGGSLHLLRHILDTLGSQPCENLPTIESRAEFAVAAEALISVRDKRDEIERCFQPPTKAAYAEWKKRKAEEKQATEKLIEIENYLREMIAELRERHCEDGEALALYCDDSLPLTYAEQWKGEVVNKMEVIQAVAAGRADIELLDVNTKELNAKARAVLDELSAVVPGTRGVRKIIVGVQKAKEL